MAEEVRRLWEVYHGEVPAFLEALAKTAPLERLRAVGMNCGCEYTAFPGFLRWGPYSRFDHSLGVALIVWHFTESREQAAAGLFHDLTTPAFAHVVDFLNGDHLRQESTEAGVGALIARSSDLRGMLERQGLSPEAVADYHRYPIADNPTPGLSADRLEYTLGNLLNYGFAGLDRLRAFYEDLTVGEDEAGRPELVFRTPEMAAAFARAALRCAYVYVADEDRLTMQVLADLLRLALDRGTLWREDLWSTEPQVIEKLRADQVCGPLWERFRGLSRVLRSPQRPEGDGWVRVDAKKRWIDPMAAGRGRVSCWDAAARAEMDAFQKLDFSHWLCGA